MYESLQFPVEMNTRGGKTLTTFMPFHTKHDLQLQVFVFYNYYCHFCLLFDRTVDRHETKLERERGGTGSGKPSRDSNTGQLKHNGATCRHAAHKIIDADTVTEF